MAGRDTAVQVEGLNELRRAIIQTKDKELGQALKDANKRAAQLVAEDAIPHVPVGTSPYDKHKGALRRSVKAAASQTSGSVKAGSPTRVPYAAAVHWGEGAGNINHTTGATVGRPARNIPGQPYLWEAADRMFRRVGDQYEEEITELMDRMVRDR